LPLIPELETENQPRTAKSRHEGHEGDEDHEGAPDKSEGVLTTADLAAACGGVAVSATRERQDMENLGRRLVASRVAHSPRPAKPGSPGQRSFMSFMLFMSFMSAFGERNLGRHAGMRARV
jgi:hypothetical protein